jgi:hypothetical protein
MVGPLAARARVPQRQLDQAAALQHRSTVHPAAAHLAPILPARARSDLDRDRPRT